MAIDGLSSRPWMLVPGTLCTGAVFDEMLDAIGVEARNRTYVTLDRPSVEDYRTDFEQLSDDTVVCSFSLGAIVAAHLANRMTVNSLMLFGLNPYADDPKNASARHDLANDVQALGGATALQARLTDVFGHDPLKTREKIFQMAEETGHLIAPQTRLALTRPGALRALAQTTMPVLSLTGSRDQSAPAAQGQAAAQSAPNGQFRELDGLGHFALLEDPEACAAVVRSWHEASHEHI